MIRCYNCGSEDAFHEPDCPDVLNAEVRRAVKAAVHDMQERLVAACERMAAAEARATRAEQLADALAEGMRAVKEWVNRKEVVGLAEVAHFHGYTISTEFWEAHGKPAWDKFNEALANAAEAATWMEQAQADTGIALEDRDRERARAEAAEQSAKVLADADRAARESRRQLLEARAELAAARATGYARGVEAAAQFVRNGLSPHWRGQVLATDMLAALRSPPPVAPAAEETRDE